MNPNSTNGHPASSHDGIPSGERTYYVLAGNDVLYGLTKEQLKSLKEIVQTFIDEKVEKLPNRMKKTVNFGVRITKTIGLKEESEHFGSHYSIGSNEGDILGLSYPKIKRLYEMLGYFLYKFGDEERPCGALPPEWGDTHEAEEESDGMKIAVGEDFAFELREEVDRAQVGVEKCIYWENGEACPQTYYMLYGNRCECSELSMAQLKRVREEIEGVLERA